MAALKAGHRIRCRHWRGNRSISSSRNDLNDEREFFEHGTPSHRGHCYPSGILTDFGRASVLSDLLDGEWDIVK